MKGLSERIKKARADYQDDVLDAYEKFGKSKNLDGYDVFYQDLIIAWNRAVGRIVPFSAKEDEMYKKYQEDIGQLEEKLRLTAWEELTPLVQGQWSELLKSRMHQSLQQIGIKNNKSRPTVATEKKVALKPYPQPTVKQEAARYASLFERYEQLAENTYAHILKTTGKKLKGKELQEQIEYFKSWASKYKTEAQKFAS